MAINTGGPVFPVSISHGLTKRDWFAGQALAGLSADAPQGAEAKAARWAYAIADAMIAAREASAEGDPEALRAKERLAFGQVRVEQGRPADAAEAPDQSERGGPPRVPRDGAAEIVAWINQYLAPWGAARTAWWEQQGLKVGQVDSVDVQALRKVREMVAALGPGVMELGPGGMELGHVSASGDVRLADVLPERDASLAAMLCAALIMHEIDPPLRETLDKVVVDLRQMCRGHMKTNNAGR